jgi:hypothetical protein
VEWEGGNGYIDREGKFIWKSKEPKREQARELYSQREAWYQCWRRLLDPGRWGRLMKAARIGGLLLLLALIGSPVQGQQSIEPRLPQENTGNFKEPDKIVGEYYAAYIAFLQYDENQRRGKVKQKKLTPDKKLDLNYVTQHFIDSYNKLIQENERTTQPGEVGLLNYDPILCAQDFPENLAQSSFILVDKTKNDALVKVCLWKRKKVKPITVKLNKQKEGWRINSIDCLGYNFESLYIRIKK